MPSEKITNAHFKYHIRRPAKDAGTVGGDFKQIITQHLNLGGASIHSVSLIAVGQINQSLFVVDCEYKFCVSAVDINQRLNTGAT